MKTITDAVNELKGHFNNNYLLEVNDTVELEHSDGYHSFKTRFNAEVTSLSHFKGEELFKQYLAADKLPAPIKSEQVDYTLPEFWKDAPEGHNYAVINNKVHDSISFYNHPPKYEYSVKFDNDHTMICFDDGGAQYNTSSFHVAERPQPKLVKPVHTQAMADNGELPSVGMECMVLDLDGDEDCNKATIDYIGARFVVYTIHQGMLSGEYSQVRNRLKVIPIDTRTSKEKAIDDVFNIINDTPFKVKEQAELMLDRIINGKIHGVTFKGEEQ